MMNRQFLLFAPLFLTISASPLLASTDFSGCGTASLQSYIGSACEVGKESGGILVFGNFNFFISSGNTDLSAADITVSPITDGLGGGFNFTGFTDFPVAAGQEVTFEIDYSLLIDPGPVVTGMDMGMDPPFGSVSITQIVCTDPVFVGNEVEVGNAVGGGPRCNSVQSFSVDDIDPPTSWNSHLDLDPTIQNSANVRILFDLVGGTTGAGFDGVTATNTAVSPVPEPFSLTLGSAGLGALILLRRRRQLH
jgi:hypothetical protein